MSNTTVPVLTEGGHLENKGPLIVGICWAFTGLSTVFVAARIYVRGYILRKYQLDDFFTILSIVCGFIGTSLSTVAVAHGNGKHKDDLTYEQQQSVRLWTTAAFCPGIMSFSIPKLAVIALLTQLLKPSTFHKWFLWSMGILCQFALLSTVGVLLGQCTPTRLLWDWSVDGTCFPKYILTAYCIATAIFSAVVDLYLAIYPATVLFKLQMPLKKKLALVVALGIGTIGGLVAIYKSTRIPALSSEDFSYDTSDLVIWTVIEGSTLIIACSIPTLKPLMNVIFRAAKNTSGSKSGTGNSYYKSGSGAARGLFEMTFRRNKKDKYGMTIVTQMGDATQMGDNDVEMGSQEKILEHEATTMESGADVGTQTAAAAENGNIIRTDSVVVSFENRDQRKRVSASTFGGQFKVASTSECKAV